jgi:alpha-L-arabinofuranosidase
LAGTDIDYLSIHYYSEGIDPKADRDAYIRKGRSFDAYLGGIVAAIKSTPGAEQVRIALDEWGWTSEPDQVAALYCATVLNCLSRVAPYVQIACKVSVVNPQATIQRVGQRVMTNPMYGIFQLFNRVHRSTAIAAHCDGDEIDVSAYKDGEGLSLIAANTAGDRRSVDVELGVRGPLTLHRIGALGIESDRMSGTRVDLDGLEVIAVEAATT